jgi:hypothetical protein
MLKKIIKLTLFCLLLLSFRSVNAQHDYETAIGIRINGGAGVTLRHDLGNSKSMEGILYMRWGGIDLTGLFQVNYPVFKEPGFRAYFGIGGNVGVFDSDKGPWFDEDDDGSQVVAGVDGQIGLEYTFKNFPLNLSIDWKPTVYLLGEQDIYAGDVGLSVRYVLK